MLRAIWTISFLLLTQLSWATPQVIVGRSNDANNTAATEYLNPMAGGSAAISGGIFEGTRSLAEGICPTGGTLKNLDVEITTAPGASASWTITLWVNGVSTSLSCAISGASAKTCTDHSNTAAITAGQPFTIEMIPSSGTVPAANTGFRFSYVFDSTTNGESIYVWSPNSDAVGNLNTAGNVRYTSPLSAPNWQTADSARLISPSSFTVKNLYVRLEADPDNGVGTQTYTFTVRENGADGVITCAISDGQTTCSDTSNTIAAVAGDSYSIKHLSSGTPISTKAAGGIVFLAATNGEFIVPAHFSISSTASVYGTMHRGSNNATESTRDSLAGTAFTITDIYVGLSAATDVDGTVTFTLREELATPASGPGCTVGIASSTCNNSTDLTTTAGNTYDTLSAPATTPGAPAAWIGYLGYIAPSGAARRMFVVM